MRDPGRREIRRLQKYAAMSSDAPSVAIAIDAPVATVTLQTTSVPSNGDRSRNALTPTLVAIATKARSIAA